MKKFSKLLALSLATALTLGMTVSAAGSTSTTNSDITSDVLAEDAEKVDADASGLEEGVTVEIEAASVADYDAASNVADDIAPSDVEVVEVVTVFNVELVDEATNADLSATVSASNPLTVTLKNVPGVVSGKQYIVLHQKKDGTWEAVSGVQPGPTLTATFTSLSPVAVVEVDEKDTGDDDDDDDDDDTTVTASTSVAATTGVAASPKTGETVPVAVLFAVASLGAAVVCSRKARYNK